MDIPKVYCSTNGWLATINSDKILINPTLHNKGKFVITGWSPSGKRSIVEKVFESYESAEAWIKNLDSHTTIITHENISTTVFLNIDGKYWWFSKSKYHQLYIAYNMNHAVAMVENALKKLSITDDIPF